MTSVIDEVLEGVDPSPKMVVLSGTKRSLVLGLDVGTSGVRAALFDDKCNEIADVKKTRSTESFSDFTELDPDSIVNEVIAAIDDLLTSTSATDRIELIAISSFWHSLLGVDEHDSLTTRLFTWADTRATSVAKELRAELNERDVHLRTGCRFHSSYWPAKLRWLQREHTHAFDRTAKWIGFPEYLCLQLFGGVGTSISMASATGLLNQKTCDWDWELVEALNIAPNTLPTVNHHINVSLRKKFISRWPGLADAKLRVIVGDGAANNVGGGSCSKDRIALMVGTSGAMRVVYEGKPPAELPSSLWCYRIDHRRMVVGGALSDGGGLYHWLTQSLNLTNDPDALAREIAKIEPDSHGLTILPFWSGERSTGWSGDATGAVLGLTQNTRPAEIVRAAFEAIAYRFALIARALEELAPKAEYVATGNALRSSPVWLQIIADVLGRRLMFGGSSEASIRGGALLALEAVGKIGSIEEVEFTVDALFEPDSDRHARYQRGIVRQEDYYQKLVS